MNHFLNVLDGFVSLLHWGPYTPRRSYVLRRDGFAHDRATLRRDVIKVGNELRIAAKNYGQQGSTGTRNK